MWPPLEKLAPWSAPSNNDLDDGVVVSAASFDEDLSFFQRMEDLTVQEFMANEPVGALRISV